MYADLDLKVSIKDLREGCNVNKQMERGEKGKIKPRQSADLGTARSGLYADRLVG